MPIDNPKLVNKARYFVDERNDLCLPCAVRLFDGDLEGMTATTVESGDCTECVAFAAGVHPSLPKHQLESITDMVLDFDVISAKLTELHAVAEQDVDYVAGILDGACAALNWVMGKTPTLEWTGK